MHYILSRQQWIPASLEHVFAFFEKPENLARITPRWLKFQITTPSPIHMAQGTEIEYTIAWLGFPVRWHTQITKYDPPSCFIDEQIKGPYRTWIHVHMFEEKDDGVLMTDRVTYKLPFGPLGRLMHMSLIGKQLDEIFNYRRNVIDKIFNEQK